MSSNSKNLLPLLIFISIFSCNQTVEIEPIIDNTPPECLLKTSSRISQGKKGGGSGTTIYNYNNEGIVISYFEVGQNDTTKYTYIENRNNLGSDINPYVIKYVDGVLLMKYFCDKNGRVYRKEIFSNPKDKFPTTSVFSEYDSKNYLTKSIEKTHNSATGEFTGDYYTSEFEYSEGSISKWYLSSLVNKKISERHIFYKYVISKLLVKTKIFYFFNFGEGNKFYPEQAIKYLNNGSYDTEGKYFYQFNAKGFLLASEIRYNDGTLEKEFDNTYQCK